MDTLDHEKKGNLSKEWDIVNFGHLVVVAMTKKCTVYITIGGSIAFALKFAINITIQGTICQAFSVADRCTFSDAIRESIGLSISDAIGRPVWKSISS